MLKRTVVEDSSRESLTLLSRPLAEARFQAAIVRALLDELQHADASPNLKQQVIEELDILSHRILEVAKTLRESERPTESAPRISNVYPRWVGDELEDDRESA